MKYLKNPKLEIKLISGTNNVEVNAQVDVSLDKEQEKLVKLIGLKFKLKCKLRADDEGFNGPDDDLLWLPPKGHSGVITADGNYKFAATLSRDKLDEDWEGNDEIYARFILQAISGLFPFVRKTNSPVVTGNF
ncbi:MAG TPA: hypothetical protein VJ810_40000 [Blastocatellia bacterium]|nr:hypothetical protein [Blastocatellia bacterium]